MKIATERREMANPFNKYFVNIANDIQSSIRYYKNNFNDLLPPVNINYFFLNPIGETEAKKIITSLNSSKTLGSNGVPTKIIKLLINDFYFQSFFSLCYFTINHIQDGSF